MTINTSQQIAGASRTPIGGVSDADLRDSLGRAVDNVSEAMETGRSIGALSRQLRVLATNTSIEASRLSQAAALTEIAHRMRQLAEQAADLNTVLLNTLQVQAHALDELRGSLPTFTVTETPPAPVGGQRPAAGDGWTS